MKVHLKGFGDPIPEEALPDPGESGDIRPLLLNLPAGVPFLKADYLSFGYTNYEAICIGGCGGKGGRTVYSSGGTAADSIFMSFGGGGGGGGLHVVPGLLDDLPDSCAVVVGQAGADGAWGLPNTGGAPLDPGDPGQDGGASSFNDDTCLASGGKGGGSTTNVPSELDGPGGLGGQGGIGGQAIAGSGAAPASDGDWDGTIGEGGGGGQGGTFKTNEIFGDELFVATSGGNGSFSYGDTSRYGPREIRQIYVPTNKPIIPGTGGGAKQSPALIFGGRGLDANPNGVVFIRLTKIE